MNGSISLPYHFDYTCFAQVFGYDFSPHPTFYPPITFFMSHQAPPFSLIQILSSPYPSLSITPSTKPFLSGEVPFLSSCLKPNSEKNQGREREREMTGQFQKSSMYMEHNPGIVENGDFRKNLDDDGRPKRTGKKATLLFMRFELRISSDFLIRNIYLNSCL